MAATLLTPIDFSEPSVRAARFAFAIARRRGAKLCLLHVDHLPGFSERMAERVAADTWEAYLHERSVTLRQRLDAIARSLGEEGIESVVARDETGAAIVRRAAAQSAELIVLAPHGAGESERFLLGGVAFDVAANAGCPVLVTRGRALPDDAVFHHPVVACVDAPGKIATGLLASLAAPGAAIDLVHIVESDRQLLGRPLPPAASESLASSRAALEDRLRHASRALGGAGALAKVHIESGDPASTLLQWIEANENDLVIVGARSLRRPAGALGAVARRLLKHSPVPVVVVPPEG